MHRLRNILYFAIAIILLCSWSLINLNTIDRANWLIGTWQLTTPRGNIYETWDKTGKLQLSGKSYMLKGKDTITFETVKLIQNHDSLFYIPTVKQQNNALPVQFAMKLITDKELVFENKAHDFPQLITYTQLSKDSLVAKISGIQNGKQRVELFPMRKVK